MLEFKNKKAYFKYEIMDTYTAGIILAGTEVKSIRAGKINFVDSYCYFQDSFLMLKNLHINEYLLGTCNNHDPKMDRILLLQKREMKKIREKSSEKGYTIIPIRLFLNDHGLFKLEIALAKGKKNFEKKNSIKENDLDRELGREINRLGY